MTFALLVLMILLIFIGMPVAFALGLTGVVGLYLVGDWQTVAGIVKSAPYTSVGSYALCAIPMFILLAEVISKGDIVREVFVAAKTWLERIPGGLAQAAILASAGMGAICGSSGAAAATMAKVSIPELVRHGYNRSFAAGIVTVSGTLAIMIPPSITFIIYGLVTENSIGKLLIAGIIPGIMTTLLYMFGILFWNKVKPGLIPPSTKNYTAKDRINSLMPIWPFLILAGFILVFLYADLATATETSGLGAFVAIVLCLVLGRINLKGIIQAGMSTIRTTTMIFTIIVGAMIVGYYFTLTNTTQNLIKYVGNSDIANWQVMIIIVLIYLVLGCLMDASAILFITLPISYPLMMSLGYDPIWFGVIVVKTVEIGLITPPVGLNGYIVAATSKTPLHEVFSGTGRLLVFEMLSLVLLLVFPILSTWLPSTMG
ncbi:MAG: TRAP transporter large permease [Clostridiaceae bacterium]|nr:TRAP transporter large permease [Clostridiaceae bacterium]